MLYSVLGQAMRPTQCKVHTQSWGHELPELVGTSAMAVGKAFDEKGGSTMPRGAHEEVMKGRMQETSDGGTRG